MPAIHLLTFSIQKRTTGKNNELVVRASVMRLIYIYLCCGGGKSPFFHPLWPSAL